MAATESLAPLARKYSEMLRLRRAALEATDEAPEPDPRRAMASLAEEFPGALRELDALPMDELERRAAAVEAVVVGGREAAPWMVTVARFHELARGALAVKRWLAGRKQVDEGMRQAFAQLGLGREWAGRLEDLAAPPGGRIVELVVTWLVAETGRDAPGIRETLGLRVR